MNPKGACFKKPDGTYMTFEEFHSKELKNEVGCNKVRQTIIDIWLTEILEDTVDREWFNFSILRLTRQMMKFYGISPEEIKKIPRPGSYPIYKSSNDTNPEYHIQNIHHPVWHPVSDDMLEQDTTSNIDRLKMMKIAELIDVLGTKATQYYNEVKDNGKQNSGKENQESNKGKQKTKSKVSKTKR